MLKKLSSLCFCLFTLCIGFSQTTDLSITVEAQDLSGSTISQVQIYEEFQYLVTISNSGDAVTNAVFSQTINANATIISYISQNPIGGATLISDFNTVGNNLTGTISSLPSSSSLEIKVIVKAPEVLGGIATNPSITPPFGTTDTNNSNNTAIISIDVTDVIIDFTLTHSQITPLEGVPITAWDDTVTYQFTITNNSSIAYPISEFSTFLELETPQSFGLPIVQLLSITCVNATNGTLCPDTISITPEPLLINSNDTVRVFLFDQFHEFSAGGALTFEMIYQYLEPECALVMEPIEVLSYVAIDLNHENISSNISNTVTTNLIEAELCLDTDVCLETVQINPAINTPIAWNEEVTFETTICNNGPLDADVLASFRNISDNVLFQILTIECIESTSTIPCDAITFANAGQYWVSNTFNIPVGEFLTIRTVIIFLEPECAVGSVNVQGIIRSNVSIESVDIFDSFLNNNFDVDLLDLPMAPECETVDLEVTKTQIAPVLPEGGSSDNPTNWEPITYEITASNLSDEDVFIELADYLEEGTSFGNGILEAVSCVSTTGTASCFPILHSNIGVEFDGIPDGDNNPDVFWEIFIEDDWLLPAMSSVTFQATINWLPNCSASAIKVRNTVIVDTDPGHVDLEQLNNSAFVESYYAPCIDLVVQTFPEFPSVIVNESFNWIVDITNSAASSDAVDVVFEDELDMTFIINGTPTCQVTSGIATCISSFSISGNSISGLIPNMEAGSTVRLIIPVNAPNFGGAFTNTAEAIPSTINNEELTPETNISISSVQVIAPTLTKQFIPDIIFTGEESILTFTVFNLATNPLQSNISFTDNLPNGVVITDTPFWEDANGCTATFIGAFGGTSFEVNNLTFPEGIASCSFSIPVSSDTAGIYNNNNSNFSNQENIDTSQTNATLTVLEDTSDVDIEVVKSVTPEIAAIGDDVIFTISVINLGSTNATEIEIYEVLPEGYLYISSTTSNGDYNELNGLWHLPNLAPNQSEELVIIAEIISANNLNNVAILQNVNETERDDSNNMDNAEVTVTNCLQIPQVFTPNNDGVNDFLIIPCIEDYPNSKIIIYNRYGSKVFENNSYLNTWDGKPNKGAIHDNSKTLPTGTYFYVFEHHNLSKKITGWVYLNY